jgi:hypothetical protein
MRQNLTNITEVNIEDVEHFYVVGTKNRDGILAGNYKVDIKKLSGGGGIDLTDKEALKALWRALQDAIQVVITNDDVEEQVDEDLITYEVINTEGFPDETWTTEEIQEFRPKVVGVFRESSRSHAEHQVSIKLDFQSGVMPVWEAYDNVSGCDISLIHFPDGWGLQVSIHAS